MKNLEPAITRISTSPRFLRTLTLLGLTAALAFPSLGHAQMLTPLVLTGYNKDVILNGTNGGTVGSVDNNNTQFYNAAYLLANPNPAGGAIPQGAVTGDYTGLPFTILPGGVNNVLGLNSSVTSGTFTLAVPLAGVESLVVLDTAGDGAANVGYTLNFSTTPPTAATGTISVPNWFDSTPPANEEVSGLGRVDAGSYTSTTASDFYLFSQEIDVPTADLGLTLDSVTFTQSHGEPVFFGMTADSPLVTPEPSTYMLIGLGVLAMFILRRRASLKA